MNVRVVETVNLGPRVLLTGEPDQQAVGEAFHHFLAGDDPKADIAGRTAMAREVLLRLKVPQLSPPNLIGASDRLQGFLGSCYAGSAQYSEWPIHAARGRRIITGRIDLLLDAGDDYAIVGHKSFPGFMLLDDARLSAFAARSPSTPRCSRR